MAHSLAQAEQVLRSRLRLALDSAEAAKGSGQLYALERITRLQPHQLRGFARGGHLSVASLDKLAEAFSLRFEIVPKNLPRGRHSS
jgi:hypothetical protein